MLLYSSIIQPHLHYFMTLNLHPKLIQPACSDEKCSSAAVNKCMGLEMMHGPELVSYIHIRIYIYVILKRHSVPLELYRTIELIGLSL